MKIIHLAERYWPHGGGVEYHLEQVNKRLVADGHVVSVVTVAHEPELKKIEVHQGVTIIRIPILSHALYEKFLSLKGLTILAKTWQKFHRWYYMARLIPLLKQAQVVHVHDVYWWIAPWWWLIPGKLFMTFHGYENEQGPSRAQQRWHQLGAAFTDGSLAIGGFHEKWYGVTPTLTSFGAVDVAADRVADDYQSRIQNTFQQKTVKRIVFIGRLQELTGARELVSAVQLLPIQIRQNIHIDMYGQGELQQSLQKIILQHALPITLHGFQPTARNELYKADVAFVSQYLAILEALVARVQILSFAASEFKRAVLQSAPYAEVLHIVGTENELAAVLQQVAEIPEYEFSSEAMRQTHCNWAQGQTWLALTNTYYQLWDESK